MGNPASIEKHEPDYRPAAWMEYELSELGMWVHLLVTRATHRTDRAKQAKDLYDAQNYLNMMQMHLDEVAKGLGIERVGQ